MLDSILDKATTSNEVIREMVELNRAIPSYKTLIAEKAGCQKSFLSLVLKGTATLTLDQAGALADYWNVSEERWLYFVLMVAREKAGTSLMRKRLKIILDQMQKSRGLP